jgi:cellobiose dehydrogenase (acceptor)
MKLILVFVTCVLFGLSLQDTYDIIFVGAGTANSIVSSKLTLAFPNKKILILDAGGPLAKRNGGTNFPPYTQTLTVTDIPGEYPNVAWTANGNQFKVKEAAFTWQGMGYGGNSQFNGMMFQSAPVNNMDRWASGWRSGNLNPYYKRILNSTKVTAAPSKDGQNYLTGIANAFRSAFVASGYAEVDTRNLTADLGRMNGYFSRPYVVTDGNGQRGGIADKYLTQILKSDGTSSKTNLKIIPRAKVSKILFDQTGTATGVNYYLRTTSADYQSTATQGTLQTVNLKANGRIIMGAGALMNPRLLYLSGVGPVGQEAQLGTNLNFKINNPAVGSYLTDHVGIQLGVSFASTNYDNANYTKNSADLAKYLNSRSGPYAQYEPVLIAHVKSSASAMYPDVEIKIDPVPLGGTNPAYNTPNIFSVMLILIDQKGNAKLKLDSNGFVSYPNIYYNSQDLDTLANALYMFLNTVLPKNSGLQLVFGPGGTSHPSLDRTKLSDVRKFVANGNSLSGIHYTGMILNHFTGTIPLESDATKGGVNPTNLLVRGTKNVHVVDACLYKPPLSAHPVATIMAGAEKASDILKSLLSA